MDILKVSTKNLHLAKEAQSHFCTRKAPQGFNSSFFDNADNHMWVALIDDEVVGMIYGYTLERFDSPHRQLFLYSIDVDAKHRKKGIGKALIKHFLTPFCNGECDEAFVFTNADNQAAMQLYASSGAIRQVSDEGEDVLFEWHANNT